MRWIDAEHAHLAGAPRAEALEDLDGGRLARAVRPEEGEDLTARDVQVDSRDGLDVAVALAQAANLDDGFRDQVTRF
jgi:hypothetical protein